MNSNYILLSDGSFISTDELYHHGVLGMKWGVRRYQNKDGTLTAAGRKRLRKYEQKTSLKAAVDENKYARGKLLVKQNNDNATLARAKTVGKTAVKVALNGALAAATLSAIPGISQAAAAAAATVTKMGGLTLDFAMAADVAAKLTGTAISAANLPTVTVTAKTIEGAAAAAKALTVIGTLPFAADAASSISDGTSDLNAIDRYKRAT